LAQPAYTAADVKQPIDLVAHDFDGPFGFAWAIRHPDAVRRIVAINTLFFSDYHWHFWAQVWRTPVLGELSMAVMTYHWHFWAQVWRTPVLGELSMAVMTRLMFGQEIRRGSGTRHRRTHN
jgi:pimeloyl-ACP methyl ester carboxylesterase